jgi:rubrerythrin
MAEALEQESQRSEPAQTERIKTMTMTLEQYFQKELTDGKIDFRLRATDSGDGVDIYIHPLNRDGATTPNLRVQGNSISMAPGSSHPDWLVERNDQNGADAVLSTPRQEELHADADAVVCERCGLHWVSDDHHFACPSCGTAPRQEPT